jgi:hypothetical protein
MLLGAISCGVVELPTASLPLTVATGSDSLGGGTDLRDVSIVAWGVDLGDAVDLFKAELPAVRGDATDAFLVTPPTDGSGVGASSIADCVVPFAFSTEDVGLASVT